MNKTIYDLELNERLWIGADLVIMKVDSGWNYMYYIYDSSSYAGDWKLHQVVFVPFREIEKY